MTSRPVLCSLADLQATGAKGVTLGSASDAREMVVVQTAQGVAAYVNRCPHMHSTLEILPDRFLDETREHLVCTTHGARFRIADGFCVAGPCAGERLESIRVVVDGGDVILAE